MLCLQDANIILKISTIEMLMNNDFIDLNICLANISDRFVMLPLHGIYNKIFVMSEIRTRALDEMVSKLESAWDSNPGSKSVDRGFNYILTKAVRR